VLHATVIVVFGLQYCKIHRVSKNDTALACYNFDLHQPILIVFGTNVVKKVKRSSGTLFFSPHLTSASALPDKSWKY